MNADPTASGTDPTACGIYSQLDVDDAGEHAARLGAFHQDYAQLSPGRYHGRLSQLRLTRLQVFRESRNQSVFERGRVEPGRIAIGWPAVASGEAWFCGTALGEEPRLLCTGADAEFLLRTPGGFDLIGVSVAREDLALALNQRGHDDGLLDRLGSHALPCPATRLRALHEGAQAALTRAARTGPGTGRPADPAHWRDAETALRDALADALAEAFGATARPAPRGNRERVVRQALEYLHANPERPLSIDALCQAVGVSRRTLQYCFEQALAVNPARYFRLWRLNGVRRALRQAAPREVQVADVASRWGFWHLPRFAGDYRQLFGELPSATLGSARH